ncbi:MAG: DUF4270 family protein [Flavobacteriia bacterium]|nr:DUF4270 family protein [Flavobacteriia bacterium]
MKNTLLTIILFFIFFSCKKEENNLGKSFVSDNDLLISGAVDTFQLITYTEADDSLVSSNNSSAMLGSYLDPVFGNVKADLYTQIRISSNTTFDSIDYIIIDSFVLALEYNGHYGNLTPQTFEVYELKEDLSLSSTYYTKDSKETFTLNWVMPFSQTQTPAPSTQVKVGENLLSPQLRIHLDTAIARNIIKHSEETPSDFVDNESFLKYFKGLKIKVNNPAVVNEGAVLYFNMSSTNTKMTIYYHYSTDITHKKEYNFLINADCADFNHVEFDNETYKPGMILQNKILGQEEYYAQAHNCRAVVEIPFLKNIPKNAVIQYAKLELPVNFYSLDPYFPSGSISAGARVVDGDARLYSINASGEYSDYTKSYIIDLRDYIQKIHSGVISNNPIYFAPYKMVSSMDRIVFNGPNTIYKKKPKLYIKYTMF